jgi:hypothetical protein
MNREARMEDNESRTYEGGEQAVVIDRPNDMIHLRCWMIKRGMESEFLHNMRLTGKVASCFVLAKQDMDMNIRSKTGRAGKLEVYRDFCERYGFEPNPLMV